jgi:hypothetical protein
MLRGISPDPELCRRCSLAQIAQGKDSPSAIGPPFALGTSLNRDERPRTELDEKPFAAGL